MNKDVEYVTGRSGLCGYYHNLIIHINRISKYQSIYLS